MRNVVILEQRQLLGIIFMPMSLFIPAHIFIYENPTSVVSFLGCVYTFFSPSTSLFPSLRYFFLGSADHMSRFCTVVCGYCGL